MQPWRPICRVQPERDVLDQHREPPFRGPWPVWTVALTILGSYALQTLTMSLDTAARTWGMVPAQLGPGHFHTLLSDLFIHGGWAHAGMNALGALAFGAPLARFLGLHAKGAFGFFLFYLVCGVLSNLGYYALHHDGLMPLAGASGAVSGLFGAACRLIEHRPGLSPITSRTVIASALAWVVINAVMGFAHYAPGMGEVSVAWEAHIAGFIAGVLLVGPVAILFREEPPPEPPELPAEQI
jgi:membrane associated rhomboid family serine protease